MAYPKVCCRFSALRFFFWCDNNAQHKNKFQRIKETYDVSQTRYWQKGCKNVANRVEKCARGEEHQPLPQRCEISSKSCRAQMIFWRIRRMAG
jgi:hypothetical protein